MLQYEEIMLLSPERMRELKDDFKQQVGVAHQVFAAITASRPPLFQLTAVMPCRYELVWKEKRAHC